MFSCLFVQALASVRIRMRTEQAMSGPCPNRIRRDAESLGYLLLREKPPVAQSFITTLERLVVFDEISDHLPRKESPVTGAMPVLVEDDRKSTRLNSSHSQISYAVFCLKKKNNDIPTIGQYEHTYCQPIRFMDAITSRVHDVTPPLRYLPTIITRLSVVLCTHMTTRILV